MTLGDFLAELEAQRARLDTAIAGLRPLLEGAPPSNGGRVSPPETREKKTPTRTKAPAKGVRMQGQRKGGFGAVLERQYAKAVVRVLAGEKVATVARDYDGVKGPTLQYRVNKAKRVEPAPEAEHNGPPPRPVPAVKIDPKTGRPWI